MKTVDRLRAFGLAAVLLAGICPAQTTSPAETTLPEDLVTTTVAPPTTATALNMGAAINTAVAELDRLLAADPESEPAIAAKDLLVQAGEQIRLRDRFTSETRQHESMVREAPSQMQAVREALTVSDEQETTGVDLPTTATAEAVEQMLAANRAELLSLQEHLVEVQNEQQRRTARFEAIPRELTEARQKQQDASLALRTEPGGEDPLVENARRLLDRARLAAADAQTSALQAEQVRYQAREELLPAARQLLTRLIEDKQADIEALEARQADLRRQEASATASQLQDAARDTETSHPLVQSVAAENTSITSVLNLGSVVERHEAAQERLRVLRREVDHTSATYTNLRNKFDSVGYSDALGALLRRHRKQLPSMRRHQEELDLLDARLADVNLQMLQTRDHVDELANPDRMARDMATRAGLDLTTTMGRAVRNEVSQLLQARQEYLEKTAEGYDNLFQTLIDLNSTEEELVRISSEFKAFIDERIFWLPNTGRISMQSLRDAVSAITDLLRPSLFTSYAGALRDQARERPVFNGFGAILFLLVLAFHRRWKASLKELLEAGAKSRLAHFSPLAMSLLYSGLYVLPVPLLLILAGFPLAGAVQVPLAVSGMAVGLVTGGWVLLGVLYAWVVVRKGGIAEVFFVWRDHTLRKLRSVFTVMMWGYVPAVVLLRMWEVVDTDAAIEASRLLLVVVLSGVMVFGFQLFWPSRSIFRESDFYREGSLRYRLRYVIALVAIGAPLALLLGALMGYMYTVMELSARLNFTIWIGLSLLVISEASFFWILVKRRKLAIAEARRRREAAAAAQATGDGDGPSGTSGQAQAMQEPMLDIAAISKQAGHLLRVVVAGVFLLALWGIWAEVLPALNYLNSVELWNVSRTVNEIDPTTGSIQTVDRLVPVTLVSLLLVVLVCVGVVVALKNIPGLLDISIYQRLGVAAGEKYAFNTLFRYVLFIVAAGYILFLLGLQWRQIQWLLAAVSVGLGFGLQEIFANFVSGVILLFERPIRVGDIVTVNGQSGRVLQIRIRATTVRNWDHEILIIPNKDLITNMVVNWTLLDGMRRICMTISVQHGADLDKAREIILQVTKNCPYVLSDPGPLAAIDKPTVHGVDFLLLAHLPNGDHLLDAKHEIVSNIQREFRAAGFSMAKPTMDLHVNQVEDS